MWMSVKEMEQYADSYTQLCVDQQTRLNHADCSAGTDTKQRLYIKSVSSGVVFFCQHCQCKGFLRTSPIRRIEDFTTTGVALRSETSGMIVKDDAIQDVSLWPAFARLWWYSYELDQADATTYDVRWHPGRERLLLSTSSELIVQGRSFDPNKAKYMTWKIGDAVVEWLGKDAKDARVVLVEDLVSLYATYERCIIWLDNDAAGIGGAMKIGAKLNIKFSVQTLTQPKEVSLRELEEMYARL